MVAGEKWTKIGQVEELVEIRRKEEACLLVRDVVDCVISGEGIPVHLKMNFVILKFSCQRNQLKIKSGPF